MITEFYQSSIGKMAHDFLCARVKTLLACGASTKTLIVGYAAPFIEDVRNITGGEVMAVEAAQMPLPYGDVTFDNVVVLHVLEFAPDLPRVMSELQRVLVSDGRLVAITPNRNGIWQWFEHIPWGEGRSFSAAQMRHLLAGAQLAPVGVVTALFAPPLDFSRHEVLRGLARGLESTGNYLLPSCGGVLIAAAQKQRYAGIGVESAARKPYVNLQWAAANGTSLGTT